MRLASSPSPAVPVSHSIWAASGREPHASVDGHELTINFGGFNCWLSVAGTRRRTSTSPFGRKNSDASACAPSPSLARAAAGCLDDA